MWIVFINSDLSKKNIFIFRIPIQKEINSIIWYILLVWAIREIRLADDAISYLIIAAFANPKSVSDRLIRKLQDKIRKYLFICTYTFIFNIKKKKRVWTRTSTNIMLDSGGACNMPILSSSSQPPCLILFCCSIFFL